ncbi:MAG: 50S ribosome-binding GTPase [Lachnospiraceae bacterium]|nr:50S ribosome-binding GTPase [Lachnospiraceae bacterium]
MEVSLDKIAQDCISAISERIKNLNTLNIIVAGKTGVGKSTLINSMFRDNLAETGIGKPVTQHMRKISKKGVPLNIYDTKGFELGKDAQKEVKKEILDTIKAGMSGTNVNKAIHCIWYCINTASNRIEPEEIEWLRDLAKENSVTEVPVIIVLTQAFSKPNAEAMKKLIQDENLDVVQIVPVLAQDFVFDESLPPIKAYGLDALLAVMTEVLPEELQDTLQSVQIASLKAKKKRAQIAVATATATAFGEGFAPIPFADSALLIPTQVAMIASITAIFGLDVNKSLITAFVSSALGAGGATIAGKTIASNLLKLVPGAGIVIGGTISGTTAGVITIALGEAYILLMEAIYKGELKSSELETPEGKKKLKELFKKRVKDTTKDDVQKNIELANSEEAKALAASMGEDILPDSSSDTSEETSDESSEE